MDHAKMKSKKKYLPPVSHLMQRNRNELYDQLVQSKNMQKFESYQPTKSVEKSKISKSKNSIDSSRSRNNLSHVCCENKPSVSITVNVKRTSNKQSSQHSDKYKQKRRSKSKDRPSKRKPFETEEEQKNDPDEGDPESNDCLQVPSFRNSNHPSQNLNLTQNKNTKPKTTTNSKHQCRGIGNNPEPNSYEENSYKTITKPQSNTKSSRLILQVNSQSKQKRQPKSEKRLESQLSQECGINHHRAEQYQKNDIFKKQRGYNESANSTRVKSNLMQSSISNHSNASGNNISSEQIFGIFILDNRNHNYSGLGQNQDQFSSPSNSNSTIYIVEEIKKGVFQKDQSNQKTQRRSKQKKEKEQLRKKRVLSKDKSCQTQFIEASLQKVSNLKTGSQNLRIKSQKSKSNTVSYDDINGSSKKNYSQQPNEQEIDYLKKISKAMNSRKSQNLQTKFLDQFKKTPSVHSNQSYRRRCTDISQDGFQSEQTDYNIVDQNIYSKQNQISKRSRRKTQCVINKRKSSLQISQSKDPNIFLENYLLRNTNDSKELPSTKHPINQQSQNSSNSNEQHQLENKPVIYQKKQSVTQNQKSARKQQNKPEKGNLSKNILQKKQSQNFGIFADWLITPKIQLKQQNYDQNQERIQKKQQRPRKQIYENHLINKQTKEKEQKCKISQTNEINQKSNPSITTFSNPSSPQISFKLSSNSSSQMFSKNDYNFRLIQNEQPSSQFVKKGIFNYTFGWSDHSEPLEEKGLRYHEIQDTESVKSQNQSESSSLPNRSNFIIKIDPSIGNRLTNGRDVNEQNKDTSERIRQRRISSEIQPQQLLTYEQLLKLGIIPAVQTTRLKQNSNINTKSNGNSLFSKFIHKRQQKFDQNLKHETSENYNQSSHLALSNRHSEEVKDLNQPMEARNSTNLLEEYQNQSDNPFDSS